MAALGGSGFSIAVALFLPLAVAVAVTLFLPLAVAVAVTLFLPGSSCGDELWLGEKPVAGGQPGTPHNGFILYRY